MGPVPEESFSSLRTLTNEAERTLDLPKRRIRHGTSPWLSTEQLWVRSKRKRRGPVYSDVVKVEGEDPATPSPLP